MKLWGGRFKKSTDSFTDHFHSSISFDKRMYKQDIQGSIAHASMLGKQGIISSEDSKTIQEALKEILSEIEEGKIEFDEKAEDIHMNIETILIQKTGDAGKKLHTGRSRNDQVALDLRMYLKEEITQIKNLIKNLMTVINDTAEKNIETIMPGYTHLQNAQPVTFAHHILAYEEMFKRDYERLSDTYRRTNIMPLGSGALAAVTYPLDRQDVCETLGFDSTTLNSMDGVSDRDFVIELLSNISMIMMHLSRFCEEIILWSNQQFRFIELDDSYSTGSSIMPQKKNPDMAELIRGKTGRVYGSLMAVLTVMKGIPLAYNKDMQEDKESVFDAVDTVKMCLPVFTNMIKTMKINKQNMYKAAKDGFMNATDAADWLVKKGMPFRDAHSVIGHIVLKCIDSGKSIEELSVDELNDVINELDLKKYEGIFTEEIFDAISLENCINSRIVDGGPSKKYVEKLITFNKDYIKELK